MLCWIAPPAALRVEASEVPPLRPRDCASRMRCAVGRPRNVTVEHLRARGGTGLDLCGPRLTRHRGRGPVRECGTCEVSPGMREAGNQPERGRGHRRTVTDTGDGGTQTPRPPLTGAARVTYRAPPQPCAMPCLRVPTETSMPTPAQGSRGQHVGEHQLVEFRGDVASITGGLTRRLVEVGGCGQRRRWCDRP